MLVSRLLLTGALCGLMLPTLAMANLVTNGGFETGDFTGWTASANSYPMYTTNAASFVHSGTWAAQIAGFSYNPNTLSQTIATTPNQTYDLSFWRYQGGGGPIVELVVTWDGTPVFLEVNPPPTSFGVYQEFSLQLVGGASGHDTLAFVSANDPSLTFLDDVSLVPVTATTPEPVECAALISALAMLGLAVRRRIAPKH